MKKKSLSILVLSASLLAACGGGAAETSTPTSAPSETVSEPSSTVTTQISTEQKKDFNVVFADKTVTYDGTGYTIDVTGAPEGTNIVYEGKGPFVNVGTYPIKATLTKDGYNEKEVSAVLKINPADFENLVFKDLSFDYDGEDHKDDAVVTGAPANTSIKYSYSLGGNTETEIKEIGEHTVTAVLTNSNFNTKTLTCKVTISAVKDAMPIIVHNGVTYFANGLDDGELYSYDGTIKKISNDSVSQFIKYDSTVAFVSKASVISSIKKLNITEEETKVDTQCSYAKYDYICANGSTLFYSRYIPTQSSLSGIYRVDINSSSDPVTTKIFEGNAQFIQYYNGFILFADKTNSGYLSAVPANATGVTGATKIADDKPVNMIIEGSVLYYTDNGLLNDTVKKCTLSKSGSTVTATTKTLSNYAGNHFALSGNYLYYSNVDLVTAFTGKGVYRVDVTAANPTTTKVVEDTYGINSLYANNGDIFFTRASDLHLYKKTESGIVSDLLSGFVAPEETPINMGGKNVVKGNDVYYLNMYKGKTLYVYNTVSKTNKKLTSNKVADFYVTGNNLYFNQVSYLVNNDLYQVNLAAGGTGTQISSEDAQDMTSDGNYLYYCKHNQVGAATSMVRTKLDGSEPVEFYDKGAENLRINGGKLYFTTGNKIYTINTNDITATSSKMTATQLSSEMTNVSKFEIENTKIYYTYRGPLKKVIRIASLSNPSSHVAVASSKTDPLDFTLGSDGYIYYYTQAESAGSSFFGIAKVSKSATSDVGSNPSWVLKCDGKWYASSLAYGNGGVYFLNTYLDPVTHSSALGLGDAHTYFVSSSGGTPTKIA